MTQPPEPAADSLTISNVVNPVGGDVVGSAPTAVLDSNQENPRPILREGLSRPAPAANSSIVDISGTLDSLQGDLVGRDKQTYIQNYNNFGERESIQEMLKEQNKAHAMTQLKVDTQSESATLRHEEIMQVMRDLKSQLEEFKREYYKLRVEVIGIKLTVERSRQ